MHAVSHAAARTHQAKSNSCPRRICGANAAQHAHGGWKVTRTGASLSGYSVNCHVSSIRVAAHGSTETAGMGRREAGAPRTRCRAGSKSCITATAHRHNASPRSAQYILRPDRVLPNVLRTVSENVLRNVLQNVRLNTLLVAPQNALKVALRNTLQMAPRIALKVAPRNALQIAQPTALQIAPRNMFRNTLRMATPL